MNFKPILPFGGNLGWSFLTRTQAKQEQAFVNSRPIASDTEYFRNNIQRVSTPDALVTDYRLLSVSLKAFGLFEDVGNRAFIRKVLEEGTLDPKSFANRLSDKRYLALAKAFGFDLTPPNTALNSFADQIISDFGRKEFERAVGQQDKDMRLALGFVSGLRDLASKGQSELAVWYGVLGTPPLRTVVEKALGLPSQIASIDIDRQVEIFSEKAQRAFGTADPRNFLEPEKSDAIVRRFLLRAEVDLRPASSQSATIALTLLQTGIAQGRAS